MSMFEKAEKHPQRLKMYAFGDTGRPGPLFRVI